MQNGQIFEGNEVNEAMDKAVTGDPKLDKVTESLEAPFRRVTNLSDAQIGNLKMTTSTISMAYGVVDSMCGDSLYAEYAKLKLEEASMWATKAITHGEKL